MAEISGDIEKKSLSSPWKGAIIALWFSTAAMLWMGIYDLFTGDGLYPFGLLVAIGGSIGLVLAAFFLLVILKLLRHVPFYYYVPLTVCTFLVLFESPIETFFGMLLFGVAVTLLPSLLGACLGWSARGYWRWIRWMGMIIFGSGVLYSLYFILSEGREDPYRPRPQEIVNAEPLALPDPSSKGPLPIKSLFYGSGNDLHRSEFGKNVALKTPSVDGNFFINGWDGWIGWIRSSFWGFDASALPLNGRGWFPEGKGPFPLILIVHGNHTMHDFSDNGYDYLSKLFASHGYIAVSIDENFLNTFWFDEWSEYVEQPARGWLILEHLKQWQKWDQAKENEFFGKVDMSRIALIGHSRGGEAIVTAAALNGLTRFPDNANISLDTHFNIKALAAISPVDGQYRPGGIETPVSNVDYFCLHGSHDGDVRSFEGNLAYQRVAFNDENYHFKSLLYVVGANHGQFNTSWGNVDLDFSENLFLNTKQLIPSQDQQKIAQVFLMAFLDISLKDKKEYLPLFWDERVGKQWLPKTQYISQFQDSKTAFAFANKKDLDITTLTIPGGTIEAENLAIWKLERPQSRSQKHLQPALYVGWDKPSSLTMIFPSDYFKHRPESVLTFSAADAKDNPPTEDGKDFQEDPIDFTVVLTDENGRQASLPLSHYRHLMPQVKTEIWKSTLIDAQPHVDLVFQTFQLPLADFVKVDPSFDYMKLKSVTFDFNLTPQGEIYIDRVGFL